jgi:hypothetical protein
LVIKHLKRVFEAGNEAISGGRGWGCREKGPHTCSTAGFRTGKRSDLSRAIAVSYSQSEL